MTPRKRPAEKHRFNMSARIVVALLCCSLLALAYAAWQIYAPKAPPRETFIDFPEGTSSLQMAQKLLAGQTIRSKWAFLVLRATLGGNLKAGEYRFVEPASGVSVYRRLRRGDVYTRTVTVPEGFNLYDIAGAVEAAGLASKAEFLRAATVNVDLIAEFAPAANSLEGYLFPDTYRFSRHTSARVMQQTMVRRFQVELGRLGTPRDSPLVAHTVILASLVEKEVHFDQERALAAGVFENRLRLGMPLQTDPSVVYAALQAHTWTGIIHRSDLVFDSPYNTYRHSGLPPGPICSPGTAALRAALHPAQTQNLYFVADGSGHTAFSQNLGEHTKNVQAYRNALR